MPAPALQSRKNDDFEVPTLRVEQREVSTVPESDPHLIYDLRAEGHCADFYLRAAEFADLVLAEIELRAADALSGYAQFVEDELREVPRSRGEHAIEFLTLGMALSRYAGAAEVAPDWAMRAARALFKLRHRPWMKRPADFARAVITRLFLMPGLAHEAGGEACSMDALPRLIAWLEATGEFEQEAARLRNWNAYLVTLPHRDAELWIKVSRELFAWFKHEAREALGRYTSGVPDFLSGEYRQRGVREDQLFCGRPAVEYHLNMIAADVMNRGLRAEFESRSKKVVLVPACMRGAYAATCKARINGTDITCMACDPRCHVNRISRRMRALGVKVYIVPHATGFSRWLERWQHEPDTGVAAVACMLNILPGGYEMRDRGIASQCVPLDYPGCAKHWREEGIATAVNEQRLVQIVGATRA